MAYCTLIRLWVVYYLVLPCTSLTFDIDRQNQDLIPNDFTNTNGIWQKIPCRNSCTNSQFNTDNSASGCRCTCKYSHSTFRMGATPQQSSCIKNEDIRKDSGCNKFFESFGQPSSQVPVLTNSRQGLKIRSQWRYNCKLTGKPQFWDRGKWVDTSNDLFEITTRGGQYLKWKNSVVSYHGRLMRQYIHKCKGENKSCIVFKAEGTLTYNVTMPTTATTTATTTGSTTSAIKLTTKQITTTASLMTTTSPPTQDPSTTLTVPVVTDIPVITESTGTVTNGTPVITEKPDTEATENPGGNNGAHGNDGSSTDDNTLMIAVIAAVAAVVCVVIICVFVWFVMKRMRRRDDKACSSNMTVITNATGTNNTNPDGSVYCEPTEQHPHFPKQLSKIGNPVYAKAMIHGNQPNNTYNIPVKAINSKDSNHHDNHGIADSGEYENPSYQDIIPVKPVKPVNSEQDTGDSTYDNCYAEPEKPLYEELPDKNVRESMYQPLIRDSQIEGEDTGIPEYLAIINEDPSNHGNEQTIPEYLTIIPDNDSQSQPRSPSLDYDYALPEGQSKTISKEPNDTGLFQPSECGTKNSGQDPVYDVLEEHETYAGNEYLTPMDGAASKKC